MAVVARQNPNFARAECFSTDGVGAMVYIRSGAVGGVIQVETADPNDYSKMPAVGMLIHKFSATECLVQYRGSVSGVYAGLTPGALMFVSDGGGIDEEPPDPTVGDPEKFVQAVGIVIGATIFNLDPDLSITRRRF